MSTEDEAKTTRRGVSLYRENPFMLSIKTRVKRVVNKKANMMLVSAETGEVTVPMAGFWTGEEVENAKFVKLFVSGVKALAELSNAGTRVFELLYIEMQNNIGSDKVYLSYVGLNEIQRESISKATFMRGIAELIDKKFIAPQIAPGWYWVNPDFIWNGDRIAFVKEYTRNSAKKAIQEVNQYIEKTRHIQPSLFDELNAQDLGSSPFAEPAHTPEDEA